MKKKEQWEDKGSADRTNGNCLFVDCSVNTYYYSMWKWLQSVCGSKTSHMLTCTFPFHGPSTVNFLTSLEYTPQLLNSYSKHIFSV